MKIQLFCCGGTGLNIGREFAKFTGKENAGFATIGTAFVDTSASNVNEVIPRDQLYLIENKKGTTDGSGGVRKANYESIEAACPDILLTHRPGDINIVLHGAAGGSGSVIGPTLVSELLSRDQDVIVLIVGSTASGQETKNTLNTLQTYEKIASLRERPVNVFYRENSQQTPRKQVDSEMINSITVLTALFSGSNFSLDKEDCRNFLNYQKVTSYPPRLTAMEFFPKTITLEKNQALISLLTVSDNENNTDSNVPAEYQATGFIHENVRKTTALETPFHAAVLAGKFNPVVKALQSKLSSLAEIRQLSSGGSIIGNDVQATDKGIVFD